MMMLYSYEYDVIMNNIIYLFKIYFFVKKVTYIHNMLPAMIFNNIE